MCSLYHYTIGCCDNPDSIEPLRPELGLDRPLAQLYECNWQVRVCVWAGVRVCSE